MNDLNTAIYTEAINQKNQQVEQARDFLSQHHDRLSGSALVHLSHLIEQLEIESQELLDMSGSIDGQVTIEVEYPGSDRN